MKRIFVAALAAVAAMTAAPAMADDFSGARVGVEAGVVGDDFGSTTKGTYGVVAGYDFDLGNVVVGPQVGATGVFDSGVDGLRELTAGARLGVKVADRTLVYGTAAYSNIDAKGLPGALDGVRVGLGLEQKLGSNVYASVETRYGNYEYGAELYQTVVGVGVRF